jgi:hypothetical protein
LEFSCVIDDNPNNQAKRLWGFPIVSRDQAASMGVGAVVLSANSIEDKLWEATASMRAKGVEVVRLHERESATRRPAASTLRRQASA